MTGGLVKDDNKGTAVKIGITYDLRDDYIAEGYTEEETAEFDHPRTIDAIEEALRDLGYETDRIGHLRALTRRLVAGDRWDLVFNIAEGLRGSAARRRSRLCWTPGKFRIPSPTRWCFRSRCTRG